MYIGNTEISAQKKEAKGRFVTLHGEKFYLIENFDAMQPFFISLASDTDLWMYISSTGGLTCGRKSPDQALFPYYTDDKITESGENTGAKTILKVSRGENTYLWEPFSQRGVSLYRTERNIMKSVVGNKLVFEEKNLDLQVSFRYMYCSADRYGWIRKSTVENLCNDAVRVEIIDGLQNVLPAGTNRVTQNTYSTLVDGYKKTELVDGSSLVLFRMEAIMVDRAEPSESLRCNAIYCVGLPSAEYLCSTAQLDAFRRGEAVHAECEAKGVRGAILAHSTMTLLAAAEQSWYMVADVDKDAAEVYNILADSKETDAVRNIEAAVKQSTETLVAIVGQNDGIQQSADENAMARHFANVLFNTMRGGFYCDNYQIRGAAFRKHIALFNKALAKKHAAFLEALPEMVEYSSLEKMVKAQGDPQLERLFLEYLPLTFSRRHGDPSRPWNLFSIRVNDEKGNRIISYQGNWRDIFQNWEALSVSYPGYINGIISKFFNATTADGYNPYKVTSEGIDWELINPDDPWSNIGYWGDHQIIYLLKLLELSYQHDPKALEAMADERLFAFANVPYRFKSYKEVVADPKNSIYFADEVHKHVFEMLPEYGQDARLILAADGQPLLASFTEKILVTLLTKLSNFIPEAGVWMNTLRPEWNDANNALVGYGASMVTLCYMRRFVDFLRTYYAAAQPLNFELSEEVASFFAGMEAAMAAHKESAAGGFTNQTRRSFADAAGTAGEAYRNSVYSGYSGKQAKLSKAALLAFFDEALLFIDESISVNKRVDGLYNAYNLIHYTSDGLEVNYLYEMLEGQVAALTSYALSADEVVELLKAMRESALYRADQNSYMLYPNRRRATFLEMNNLPEDVKNWPEYKSLLDASVLMEDRQGGVHFHSDFRNAEIMKAALEKTALASLADKLADVYEDVFHHQAFTGRSGTFYKYEGLGSIYWHMVSKLLLAVAENIRKAENEGASAETIEALKAHYYDIQDGIGAHKQPAQYGSFPFDPYSHTPQMAGVQQPGMTGQVKEDILNRFFELGLNVQDGMITISDTMLKKNEFLNGELRFTYCATPFVYTLGKAPRGIVFEMSDGKVLSGTELVISKELSQYLFARSGAFKQITVNF